MSNAFRLEERDDRIAVLTFDLPEKKVNTLGRAVLEELGGVIARLAPRADLRGLLFRSGKPGQFIAGADLKELGAMAYASKDQITQALGMGHKLFGAMSDLPFPTIALIDGACMGGGTELVLAMDERIVSNDPQTKIALPEVKVGLMPGWGGTQRLPRLIGVNAAIEMITSGEPVSAAKAVSLGLAFDSVPADRLVDEGVRVIDDLQLTGEWRAHRETRRGPIAMTKDSFQFTFGVAEGAIVGKTKGQYPAPLAAMRAIRDGSVVTLADGLQVEAKAAGEVVGSPISANLIGVFFAQNRLGRDFGVDDSQIRPKNVARVGVLGAGFMGAGIATALARSGIPAEMVDVDEARVAEGMKRAQEVVAGRIKIGRATPLDMAAMLTHLNTATTKKGVADCDFVIEAVPEDRALKSAVFRELSEIVSEDTILATNTSTISIGGLAGEVTHPERFLGMHFFSPVDRMELVEVVRGDHTSDQTLVTAVNLARKMRKTPIVVRDCAGFLVNRVLFPYMAEALLMLREGVPMDTIDAVAEQFGMPMGPIALEDMVGLDTAAFASRELAAAYPDRTLPTPVLFDLVRAGRLGKKTGAGFRKYTKDGKAVADPEFAAFLEPHRQGDAKLTAPEIQDRLILPMLLEATRALEEGIAREPGDVDMALILGIGFPAFRGGLLRWADTEGAGPLLDRIERHRRLGARFAPTDTLQRMAVTGETFYPRPKVRG